MDIELDQLNKEVQCKIGRNVLLFHKIEKTLKELLSNVQCSGYASEIAGNRKKKVTEIRDKTFGQLKEQFINNINPVEKGIEPPSDLKEPWLSFEQTIECSSDYYEERKQFLTSVVEGRNLLIHQFNYDLDSIYSCKQAESFLDQQWEKANSEFHNLKNDAMNFQKAREIAITYFSSAEFEKSHNVLWLKQSNIVQLLCDYAKNKVRPDGWALLSSAGNFIKQKDPDELDSINERYGYRKLKELVLATDLFDVCKKSVDGGGYYDLYRVKSDNF